MNRIQKRIIEELFMQTKIIDGIKWYVAQGEREPEVVNNEAEVEVRLANGETDTGRINQFDWSQSPASQYDILYWRWPETKTFAEELEKWASEKKTSLDEVFSGPNFHGEFERMSEEEQDQIINPKHYKMIPKEAYEKFPEGLEYMNLMEYILAHHKGVEAHLLGQIFKYACRLGKKDADLQDARKIQWYANYLVNVIEERSK